MRERKKEQRHGKKLKNQEHPGVMTAWCDKALSLIPNTKEEKKEEKGERRIEDRKEEK